MCSPRRETSDIVKGKKPIDRFAPGRINPVLSGLKDALLTTESPLHCTKHLDLQDTLGASAPSYLFYTCPLTHRFERAGRTSTEDDTRWGRPTTLDIEDMVINPVRSPRPPGAPSEVSSPYCKLHVTSYAVVRLGRHP
ncbi:hypothetical protein EVAR_40825_1 [Eumeta japonica]|uniref:Uncharacterized protein n=1 Tax=Eumeta variegata TaxID=151549 RepID=A0A4C1WGS3_EUMVA|nr:hypothetical protein EVAR_40825_1 [Eumeta japonica]